MAQQEMKPFERGTRRRRNTVTSLPYLENQQVDVLLPKTGILQRVRLAVFMQATASAATAFAATNWRGALGILPGITLETNQATQIFQGDAWSARLISFLQPQRLYESSLVPDTLIIAPAGAGVFNISFSLEIPVSLNDGLNWTLGALNLQSDDVEVRLKLTWGSFQNLFAVPGNISLISGLCIPEYQYLDVPDPTQFALPDLRYIHKTSLSSQDILADGDTRYVIPRGNIYTRLIHQIIVNNAPATTFKPNIRPAGNVQTMQLLLQQGVIDEKNFGYFLEMEQRRRYAQQLPQGVFVMDNLYDTDIPGRFEFGYNLLDSNAYSDIQQIFGLQNTVLGSSKIWTIRQELVELLD